MQTFKDKLLVAGVAAIFFGATGVKPKHNPLDAEDLAKKIKGDKVALGDTMSVRAFIPLGDIRFYNGRELIIAGVPGNAENLGMLVCETKGLDNKVPEAIDGLMAKVKAAFAKGEFAKIGEKKPVGTMDIGPMQLVEYVATAQGWQLVCDDADLAVDSELVGELRDQVRALSAENKALKITRDEDKTGLQTTIKERDQLKAELKTANEANSVLVGDLETAHKDLETATTPPEPVEMPDQQQD